MAPQTPTRFTFFCLLASLAVLLISCRGEPDPQEIVEAAIEAHGGPHLDHAIVTFDFRGKHFTIRRDGGLFSYERAYTDSTGNIREVLSNDSLYRERDGIRVPLSERQRLSLEEAINSVVYFSLLPIPLDDPAVQKEYLGQAAVNGELYDQVGVTFREEGGGRDYQDRFVYWFHADRRTMDYFVYTFDNNGGGTRFREAVNPRIINGVRFADYMNYSSDLIGDDIENYDQLVATGNLELVSTIEMHNITVAPLPQ